MRLHIGIPCIPCIQVHFTANKS